MLYQVKASYKYQAEDVDELNFEVGEVVDVVEYDDPEEQVCGNIVLWIFNHKCSSNYFLYVIIFVSFIYRRMDG